MSIGSEKVHDWRSVAMDEYKTLREESLQAQRQHHSALQLGFSGLAVLVGLSVALRDRTVAAVVLLAAVPLLVAATTLIWLNELRRMVRAGAFLVEVEGRVNEGLPQGPPALSWETSLRRGSGPQARLINLYRAIFAILLGLEVLAALSGMWLVVALRAPAALLVVAPIEIAVSVVLLDLFARFEVVLHDTGRGDYPGADFVEPRPDLAWPRPVQAVLDLYATIRGRPLLPRAANKVPRISLAMLACGGVFGRYPQWTLSGDPDCVVAFAFGFHATAEGREPGKSNERLGVLTAEVNPGIPMVLQEEVAQALGLRDHDAVPSVRPGSGYQDTHAIATAMKLRLSREGLGHALVVAHPHHVARACAELLGLGVKCEPAPQLEDVGFDSESAQFWTRHRLLWALREVPVLVVHPSRRAWRRVSGSRQ